MQQSKIILIKKLAILTKLNLSEIFFIIKM